MASEPPSSAGLSKTKRALLNRLLQGVGSRTGASEAGAPAAAGAAGAPSTVPRRDEAGPARLSFAQERLWFLDQFEPEVPFYNVTGTFRLLGRLDFAALDGALRRILRRHEVLRSRIEASAEGPRQRVLPLDSLEGEGDGGRPVLPRVDLSALPPETRRQTVRHLAAREARRPFDLGGDRLLRTTLVHEGAESCLLLLSLHHIAADGWSVGVLFRELGTLYRDLVEGRAPSLPPLAVQYADFAEWQRQWLTGGELERQLDWWRRALDGAPTVLDLPTDRPRPATQSFRGHTVRGRPFGADLTRALERRAEASGVTLFMLLLAAFQTLLWRFSGATDLLVGSPIANRNRLEIEPLIGFFVNTLVLRGRPGPTRPLGDLLAEVRRNTLGAYDHQDLPFEKLVEALQPPRDLSRSPLFQVLLVLQNAPLEPLELPRLTLSMEQLDNQTAKFDLLLSLVRDGDSLVPWAEASSDLFDRSSTERMLRSWRNLLRSLAAAGDATPLGSLDLLDAAERHQLLVEHAVPDPAGSEAGSAVTIVHRFRAIAARVPDRVAVEPSADPASAGLTYGELHRRARWLASRLRRLGAGPDRPVALCLDRGPEAAIALLATLEAGSPCLPLDPAYPLARREHMLQEARPAALLSDDPELGVGLEIPRIDLRDGCDLAGPAADEPAAGPGPDHLAYVLYTSGSTGRPKGVAMPHDPFARLMAWQLARSRGEHTLQLAPTSFDVAMQELFATWLAGGTLVLVTEAVRRDPEALWRHLARHRVERLFLPFVALQQLAETAPATLPPLRAVLTAGEQLRVTPALRQLFRRLPDARLENQYGPTETHVVTAEPLPADPDRWPALPAIGRPVAGAEAYVLDARLQPVPAGVPGELCIGGAAPARGYLAQPAATAERFVPDPFARKAGRRLYKTGDRVRSFGDGRLEFLGRWDHQVKVRGFRIEPGEIEAALGEHPDVAETVVTVAGSPDGDSPDDGRHLLVAGIVPRPASDGRPVAVDGDELRDFLRHRLPAHMVPATVHSLESLPLTPSGKVDRRAAARRLTRASTPDAESTPRAEAPRNAIEEALAVIWGELLGRDPHTLGRREDFFALGGHSLLATRVISRIRERFGVELAVRALFEAPTLEGLSRRITTAGRSEAPSLEPAGAGEHERERAAGAPLTFAQERLWFLEQLAPGDAAYHVPGALDLTGPLDVGRLVSAFDRLVRRHPIWSVTFRAEDGIPRQHPGSAPVARLRVVDLRALPGADGGDRAEADTRTEAEARRPFALDRGPLVRARLLLLADDRARLVLVQHHMVSDGWSLGILLRELAALYRDADAALPSGGPSYFDFARWQRRWLRGAALEAGLAWWRQRLAPPRARLELPTDRPRTARPGGRRRGAHLEHTLAPETGTAVLAFGREMGATPFMVLLAAFETVLARWSGETDLLVGCPVAGRNQRRTEDLAGFFVDTLVLRTDLSGEPGFRETVARVRETALGAFAHQELPFEKLVEALEPERDLGRTPLFQVFFNVLNIDEIRLDLPGIEATPVATGRPEAKFDLTLYARELEGRLCFDLIYDRDLFTAARMTALLTQLERLLKLATDSPETPNAAFDLRPADPSPLPDPHVPLPAAAAPPLHLRFLDRAAEAPDRLALESRAGDRWTYADLERHSAHVARLLVDLVGPAVGDPGVPVIAVEAPRIPALAGALLGTWRAGAAFLLLDPSHPPRRKAEMLRQARPVAWLGVGEPAPEVADQVPASGRIRLAETPPTETVHGPVASPGPDTLAYLAFTSGSSGRPKGIRGNHRPLGHFLDTYATTFGLGPRDRFTALSGLGHDPFLRDLLVPLALGASVLLPDLEHPAAVLPWLAERRATVAHLTPSLAAFLADAAEGSGARLEDLRLVGFGGEPLRHRDTERLRSLAPRAACWNFYGATETPQVVAWQEIDPAPPGEDSAAGAWTWPVGRGIDGVQLLVLRGRFGEPRPAAVGELGEVAVRSPYLAAGYVDETETSGAFGDDPFGDDPDVRLYRTGDLGRFRPDGSVELAGRADRQLAIRGYRIEPAEIERALADLPGVGRAAVVPGPAATGGDLIPWAFLTPAARGEAPDPETLARHLSTRLPEAFQPRLVWVDALPLTASGKVDLGALGERAAARASEAPGGEDPHETDEAPRGATEELVAELFTRVLGCGPVGRRQSFFALGGHSLLAVQVLARLRAEIGREVPLRGLFEHPTVAGLAAWLDRRPPEEGSEPPLRPGPPGPAPLSPAQERLWFLDRLDPGPAYNMPVALRLEGELDPGALQRALALVIDRHQVLRSAFEEGEKGPTQTPRRVPTPWTLADLSVLPAERAGATATRLLRAEARRPFDLARPPLLRGLCLRLAERHHLLLLTAHHIAADAWSFARLLAELQHLASGGTAEDLPVLAVQVTDVARWQRRRLETSSDLAASLAVMQRRLAGAPTLELPTDRRRSAGPVRGGGRLAFHLPADLVSRLEAACEAEGATPYMGWLAAFQILLGRLAGQDDVVVGTAVAGRERPEIEPLVGLFVNTLPMRLSFGDGPGFTEILARSRERSLEAHAHRELPFETLVEALAPERRLDRNPIFQAMFVLQNQEPARFELPGTTVEPVAIDTGAAKFDLVLHLIEDGRTADGIDGWIEYRRDLFDPATVYRFARSYRRLLAAAVAEPRQPVDRLPWLGRGERHQLLAEWNDTRRGPGEELGEHPGADNHLARAFFEQARHRSDAVALLDGTNTLTYATAARRVRTLAERLRRRGVGRDRPVAVLLPRDNELAMALLAVLAAGGVFVPLDLAFPDRRVVWILRRLGAPVLVAGAERGRELRRSEAWAEAPPACEVLLPATPGAVPEPAPAAAAERTDEPSAPGPDDPAYIVFTSGSTGRPKGVAVRHRPVLELIQWARRRFDLGPRDRVAWVASASFDLSIFDLFGLLAVGGSVRVAREAERRDPEALVHLLETEGITFWDSAPPALARLVPFFPHGVRAHALRTVFLSGDWIPVTLPDQVRAAFPGARVIALGGATEAVVWSNVFPVGEVDPEWPSIPYGRPIRGARYHVLDRHLAPCPTLVEGDLYIGGSCLADGYVGAGLTAERFLPDLFVSGAGGAGTGGGGRLYRTGDRARYLADGNLEFRGRRDHQVKLRGHRVELGEIEAVLGHHSAVRHAAAGVREVADDARLLCWVVPAVPGAALDLGALRDHLRQHLPEYMLPAAIVPIESFPTTNNGKLDRPALPLPEAPEEDSAEPPAGPDEERVAAVWCSVLGLPRVGRHQSFFELGGHSLSATRVLAALRRRLGAELSLRTMFERPTVAALAAEIAAGRRGPEASPEAWVCAPLPPEERRDAPLSFAQERLWFLHRLEPGLAVYNIPLALEITGALDIAALERALSAIEQHHDVLRRRFPATAGGPRQVLAEGRHLERRDLPEAAAADDDELARLYLDPEARRPFALESGPPWRTTLLRLEERRHVLQVTFHHLAADGWSLGLFVRELGQLYGHFTARGPEPEEAPEITYVDHAAAQRRWLEGGGMETQLAYWRERLAGLPPLLELPTDRPRPRTASYRGGRRPIRLEPGLVSAVDQLAREAGATRSMVFLAALAALLHRVTLVEDLAVGSAVSGRHRAESEGLIGLFVNSLVLRMAPAATATGHELLGRAREVTLGAHDHQDIPFERLVEELDPHRGMTHNPLFQVLLVLQNTPPAEAALGDLRLRALTAEIGLAKFDLQLALDDGGNHPDGAIGGSLDFARDLFDDSTAERLARGFHHLLRGLVHEPWRPLGELPLLTEAERHQLTVEWNPGGTLAARSPARPPGQLPGLPLTGGATLGEHFTAMATARPDAPALTADGRTLTYRELLDRAGHLAWHLRGLGVGPEVPVALYLDRDADLVVALLGALLAGGAYLPMDPIYPAERLAFLLEDSGAPVLVTSSRRLRDLDPRVERALTGRAVVALDATAPESHPQPAPPPAAGPEHLAYIIYTSGSTGRPKGTGITHHNALRLFAATAERFRFGPDDVIPLFHSPAFDFSVWELWSAFLFGGRLVAVPYLASRSPRDFRRLLAAEGATVVNQTPSAFRQLEEADRAARPETDGELRLRLVIFGGEALDFASLESWIERHGDGHETGRGSDPQQDRETSHGPRLVNGYGITETTVFLTFREVRRQDLAGPPGSYIGRAMPDLELRVVDPRGRPVPLGTWGELLVGGPGLGRGYLGRPALTARRFLPHPAPRVPGERLYRSGDLVRYRGDGDLEYQGRIDHQVQLRGFRVELGEIEAALTTHPAVAAAVVLAREDTPGDVRLVAYLKSEEAAGAEAPSADDLRAFLEPRLPAYMVPAHFELLAGGLPLNANGKADRKALARRPPPAASHTAADATPPRNPTESQLAELWREVLGVEQLGIDDSFFDLGGHSLLLARLHGRIQETFAREVPMVELFHHPTIRAFAAFLEGSAGAPGASTTTASGAEPAAVDPTFRDEKRRAARQIAAQKRRPRRPRGGRR